MHNDLSAKTLNRLTQYYTVLRDYNKRNIANITSVEISHILKIDETQVRKDIKCINFRGKCKVGYSVSGLKKCIEDVLNMKTIKHAYVIGAGNLGIALSKYSKFREFGLEIVGLFDIDESKIGTKVGELAINNIDSISDHINETGVNIAILTVPNNIAQNVCDHIVRSGIKYIWNFAPSILKVPDDVSVWQENLIGSFLQFCAVVNHVK